MEQFHFFVEQFHYFWNSVPKMWNSSPKSGTGSVIGSQFHKLWNSSTICGRAPTKCSMLFQDAEQCATLIEYHIVVDRRTIYDFDQSLCI